MFRKVKGIDEHNERQYSDNYIELFEHKKILLSDDQVRELKKVLKSAKVCDTVKCRCRVLLDLDMSHGTQYTYEQCANRHGMSKTTVRSVIDTFSSGGLNAVLTIR